MSPGEAAGRGARAIRQDAGATLTQVAKAARFYGLPWSTGKVGDFEAGRIPATLPTLLVVALALGDVVGHPVSIAELFGKQGRVAVTDRLILDATKVRAALSGGAVVATVSDVTGERERLATALLNAASTEGWPRRLASVSVGRLRKVLADFSEADERMCKNIGVDHGLGIAAMAYLWSRSFSAERDRLAGADANAQKRGRISRELKAELQEVLDVSD